MDRTKLAGDYCDEGRQFEAEHDLPYTKRNCKLVQRLTNVASINCSLLRTSKIATEGTYALGFNLIAQPRVHSK